MSPADPALRSDVHALFVEDGASVVPTTYAVGPWRRDTLHGSAVAALFGSVLDSDDATVARVTVDILSSLEARAVAADDNGRGGRATRPPSHRRPPRPGPAGGASHSVVHLQIARERTGASEHRGSRGPRRRADQRRAAAPAAGPSARSARRMARFRELGHGAAHQTLRARRDARMVPAAGARARRPSDDRIAGRAGRRRLHVRRHVHGALAQAVDVHEHRPDR